MDFTHSSFYIQIHGLPLHYINKVNIARIGALFSKVTQVDNVTIVGVYGKNFLCCNVDVDLTQPLLLGFFHCRPLEFVWVQICYKKLGDLCYHCGVLRHTQEICTLT